MKKNKKNDYEKKRTKFQAQAKPLSKFIQVVIQKNTAGSKL